MSLLAIKALDVSFKTKPVTVVNRLDLQIAPGTVFGLAGESGCGKSMTALAVMGILPQVFGASGSVSFDGRELLSLDDEAMRRLRGKDISMVFQEPMTSLNPVLRVGYQIEEVLTTHLALPKAEARAKTVDLLRAVRIPSPETRVREYPHQMSGGMRQRAMIAMAIACGPKLLIADEPTTALDVTIQAQILELLRGLIDERGMSMLLITHDLGIIYENAEHVAIMYAGRIVETAPVAMLFASPGHPYTMGLLGSLPEERGTALKPIPGTVPKPEALPPGCTFSDRCPHMIPRCQEAEPPLDEVAAGHRVRCIRAGEL